MTSGLRIAEVARQSGFTAATLRYYEEIGLLPAPARTAAGYRLYDGRILDRLGFITRAKQLGCTLEEIADLSAAWDGGQCGPVQDRLRMVVAAKRSEAEARIVELVTLIGELRAAAIALERHRPDGPCDDRSGCTAAPDSTMGSVTVGTNASAAGTPVACTLAAESMPARLGDWAQMLRFVRGRSAIDGGLRLDFDPTVPLEAVVRLTAAEQDCCGFLAFALTIDGGGVALEVRAPADGMPVVHALFGSPGRRSEQALG